MSHNVPAPLPPPPPCPPSPTLSTGNANPTQRTDCQKKHSVHETVQQWIETRSGNFQCFWNDVEVVLQNGPQCGLVCLAMAATRAGIVTTVDEIFTKAKDMHFTKQGEMFSARNMQLLAEAVGLGTHLVETNNLDSREILRQLLDGKQLLIPYDADFNHEPCLKKGHKAHWALVIGFIYRDVNCDGDSSSCSQLTRINTSNRDLLLNKNVHARENLHFIARQGKSKHIGIWQLRSIVESNLNLFEVDPKRNDTDAYALPQDMSALRGKAVFVSGATAALP